MYLDLSEHFGVSYCVSSGNWTQRTWILKNSFIAPAHDLSNEPCDSAILFAVAHTTCTDNLRQGSFRS